MLHYSLFTIPKKSKMWENKDELTRGTELERRRQGDDKRDEQLLRRLEKIGLSER